ncbi:MAG: hypothetical protein KC561_12375 [Myxococcales bacterium]|nr:hypothetical protein [Myxococcales bacterium]
MAEVIFKRVRRDALIVLLLAPLTGLAACSILGIAGPGSSSGGSSDGVVLASPSSFEGDVQVRFVNQLDQDSSNPMAAVRYWYMRPADEEGMGENLLSGLMVRPGEVMEFSVRPGDYYIDVRTQDIAQAYLVERVTIETPTEFVLYYYDNAPPTQAAEGFALQAWEGGITTTVPAADGSRGLRVISSGSGGLGPVLSIIISDTDTAENFVTADCGRLDGDAELLCSALRQNRGCSRIGNDDVEAFCNAVVDNASCAHIRHDDTEHWCQGIQAVGSDYSYCGHIRDDSMEAICDGSCSRLHGPAELLCESGILRGR